MEKKHGWRLSSLLKNNMTTRKGHWTWTDEQLKLLKEKINDPYLLKEDLEKLLNHQWYEINCKIKSLGISVITHFRGDKNDVTKTFVCHKCGVEKLNTHFSNNRKKYIETSRTLDTVCKLCRSNKRKENYHKVDISFFTEKELLEKKIIEIYRSCKNNAKNTNKTHTITKEDIFDQYKIQNGLCYYTGEKMNLSIRGTIQDNIYDNISIDRKDSNIGYTKENIVLAKLIINQMKSNLTINQFKEYCKQVVNYGT